jgi:hypothetical protein
MRNSASLFITNCYAHIENKHRNINCIKTNNKKQTVEHTNKRIYNQEKKKKEEERQKENANKPPL